MLIIEKKINANLKKIKQISNLISSYTLFKNNAWAILTKSFLILIIIFIIITYLVNNWKTPSYKSEGLVLVGKVLSTICERLVLETPPPPGGSAAKLQALAFGTEKQVKLSTLSCEVTANVTNANKLHSSRKPLVGLL